MKQFGQVVLQVESCSMDVILQIFKRSICPSTHFFESLVKKLSATMDDLFKRVNKYSILKTMFVRLHSRSWSLVDPPGTIMPKILSSQTN